MRQRLAALLAVLAFAVGCGEQVPAAQPPGEPPATEDPTTEDPATGDPTPAPAATPDAAATPDPPAAPEQDAEVLWQPTFSPGYDWERDAGVVEASRTNGGVLGEGPDGRTDVLAVEFGEDGSRWGIDLRHDLARLGVEELEEVYFSYDVYFPADFEFRGDGKMAGLAGVTAGLQPLEASAGGSYDERSFSVRPTWQADRGLIMYLYARSALARDIENPHHGGFGIPERFVKADGTESDVFMPDTWHRIEQRVRLNTPGGTDGVYELWVDGHKGLSVEDVQYRTEAHPDLDINQLLNSWFFGGGSEEYPTRRSVAYSDRWALTTSYLGEGIDALPSSGERR